MKASKVLLMIGGIWLLISAIMSVLATIFFAFIDGIGGLVDIGLGIYGMMMANDPALLAQFQDFLASIFGDITPFESLFASLQELSILSIFWGVVSIIGFLPAVIYGIVVFVFQLIPAIIALKASGKNKSKGKFIAVIIFTVIMYFLFGGNLIMCALLIVGSIIGMANIGKEQAKVITVK